MVTEYYGHNDWRDYHLSHHGVLGMHWGIRRYQPYGSGGYNPQHKGKEIGEARKHARLEKKITRLSNKQAKVQSKADKINKMSRSGIFKFTTFGDGLNDIYYRKQKKADRIGRKIDRLEKRDAKLQDQKFGSDNKSQISGVEKYKQKELRGINERYDRKFNKQQERFNKLNESYSKLNENDTRKIDKIDRKLAKLSSEMYMNRAMKEVETSKVMNYTYEDVRLEQYNVGVKKGAQAAIATIIGGPLVGVTVAMLTGTSREKTNYRTGTERDSIREKAKALENASYEGVKKLNGNSNSEAEARRIADKAGNNTNEVKFGGQNGSGNSEVRSSSQVVNDRISKAKDDISNGRYYDYNDYSDNAIAREIVRNGKNPSDANMAAYKKALKAENKAYEDSMYYNEIVSDFNPQKYNRKRADELARRYEDAMKKSREVMDRFDSIDSGSNQTYGSRKNNDSSLAKAKKERSRNVSRAKALAASGYSYAEIAKKLGVSASSVSAYING